MIRLLKILWELTVRIVLGSLVVFVIAILLTGLFTAGVQSGYTGGYVDGVLDNEERKRVLHDEFCA